MSKLSESIPVKSAIYAWSTGKAVVEMLQEKLRDEQRAAARRDEWRHLDLSDLTLDDLPS